MIDAYVLIQTEVGRASIVVQEIYKIDVDTAKIESADDVTGPYDVIVRATAEHIDDLGKLVNNEIHNIDGVTRTLTCPIVKV